MGTTDLGEQRAFEALAACDPQDVCRRAEAAHDAATGVYRVTSFGRPFAVDPAARTIVNLTPEGQPFLGRFAYFFRLSALWYLVRAVDRLPSGTLVKPVNLEGGAAFFRGSHVLPLEAVAGKYGTDREGFLAAGARMAGERREHGDAAVELRAYPRLPTTVILWTADEEFPARADLLFDATAQAHLPLDLLWSVAMMSVLGLL
jgi:hypothetical protein